ncbi:MAG: NAD(P)/FAD-dependent oxidoreductase [Bacteroidetes bacterium]|nr:NAD(P)/FAD-dependent oxidoreductase [Bacteroidota bacterium]
MSKQYDYVIIGAGFAGMCMAIKLKQAGFHNFVILERNKQLGGTWYDNHYPGAACDVQSHLYSFSFEPNANWSRMFGPQQEILQYMEHCATKYELRQHFQFNTTVTSATFNDTTNTWTVTDAQGNNYTAKAVIGCSGGLSQPAMPDIKGMDTFEGKTFHSAQWDNSYDLKGKRIAIIGTGASAIQIVPAIAEEVKDLLLFQRTPPWIMPKPDRKMRSWEMKLFKALPFTQSLFRGYLYWVHEAMAAGFVTNPAILRLAQGISKRHLKKAVKDEALRAKLTPTYTMGCKRILLSNNYYPALTRSNVQVLNNGIAEINTIGVKTIDGTQHDVDAIIYATGFHAADGVMAFDIKGKNGLDIHQAWQQGAEAYLGTTVAGFPNLFLIVGPNTGLGHSSMILMIEAQVQYIMEGIKAMRTNKWKTVEVKPEVQQQYNETIHRELAKTVWQSGGCVSWYQNKNGKNVTLYPGYTFTFMRRTKRFEADKYHTVA